MIKKKNINPKLDPSSNLERYTFALCPLNGKNPVQKEWQLPENGSTFAAALTHSGNVGIRLIDDLVCIDIDSNAERQLAVIGDLAETTKVQRGNALDRVALLFHVDVPCEKLTTRKFRHVDRTDKSFDVEVLTQSPEGNAKHKLIHGMYKGGWYKLGQTYPIKRISCAEYEGLIELLTVDMVEKVHKKRPDKPDPNLQADETAVNKLIASTGCIDVFSHYGLDFEVIQSGDELRLAGNGGLIVRPEENIWFNHSDEVGGDSLAAVAYCEFEDIDTSDKYTFKECVKTLAKIAGVPCPQFTPRTKPVTEEMEALFNQLSYGEISAGGLSDLWLALHGPDFMHISGTEEWYQWTDSIWSKVDDKIVRRSVALLMEELHTVAKTKLREARLNDPGDKATIKHLASIRDVCKRSANRVKDVLTLSADSYAIGADDLNMGNALNLANGLYNISTKEFRPHQKDDLQTYKLTYNFDPLAKCPGFLRFLREVLVRENGNIPDDDLVKLILEFLGYSLTTSKDLQKMLWLAGEGANGKSVLISIIQKLLGPLATSVEFENLGDSGNYDMAGLVGKRVIFSTEAAKGRRINEKALKQIVSTNDTIKARQIYGKPTEFVPVAKVIWSMNDKPVITDTTNAIWRRMILVPFNRVFEESEQQLDLIDILESELSGILNVCLEALDRLNAAGLFTESSAVKSATEDYKLESNPVAQWLQLYCATTGSKDDKNNALTTSAYAAYDSWCNTNGRRPINSANFGKELKRLGIENYRKKAGKYYMLKLKKLSLSL